MRLALAEKEKEGGRGKRVKGRLSNTHQAKTACPYSNKIVRTPRETSKHNVTPQGKRGRRKQHQKENGRLRDNSEKRPEHIVIGHTFHFGARPVSSGVK